MNVAKGIVVGIGTGLLAVVVAFVAGSLLMMFKVATSSGGGIVGFAVPIAPVFVLAFAAGFALTIWRGRHRTQAH